MVLSGVNSQKRDISLTYRKRDKKFENRLESERVTAHDLKSVIDEAGEPARLSNLTLTASQETPSREVIIKIGPGRHTTVFVEAEADDTWLPNIHKQLLERFRKTQNWYAPSGWWKVGYWLRSLPSLVTIILLCVLAVPAFIVAIYYFFIVIQVPYELIVGLVHHKKWNKSDWFYFLASLAVITVTAHAISFLRAHDQSIVIAKPPVPLLSANRVKIFKIIAAIVAFTAGLISIIAAIVAIFK